MVFCLSQAQWVLLMSPHLPVQDSKFLLQLMLNYPLTFSFHLYNGIFQFLSLLATTWKEDHCAYNHVSLKILSYLKLYMVYIYCLVILYIMHWFTFLKIKNIFILKYWLWNNSGIVYVYIQCNSISIQRHAQNEEWTIIFYIYSKLTKTFKNRKCALSIVKSVVNFGTVTWAKCHYC